MFHHVKERDKLALTMKKNEKSEVDCWQSALVHTATTKDLGTIQQIHLFLNQ